MYYSIIFLVSLILIGCNDSKIKSIDKKQDDNSISTSVNQDSINGIDDRYYKKYFNLRFNTTVSIPQIWVLEELPENGDGFEANDINGSGNVLFSGAIAFKSDLCSIYKDDEIDDFYESVKPYESSSYGVIKDYSTFLVKSKGKLIPTRAILLKYFESDKYCIEKIKYTEEHYLSIKLSCNKSDTSRYKFIFQKMLNDIVIEEGGINAED